MSNFINSILEKDAIISLLNESERGYVFNQLKLPYSADVDNGELLRFTFFLINSIYNEESESNKNTSKIVYKLLKLIDIDTKEELYQFGEVFGIQGIDSKTLYYLYLANLALKAEKQISIRIDLKEFRISVEEISNWKYRLLNKAIEAYILLVRKQNGYKDIEDALSIIEGLKKDQKDFEEKYLKKFNIANEVNEAYDLLSLYHLSKAVIETASYLIKGYDYKGRLDAVIRQHIDIAKKLVKTEPRLTSVFNLIEFGLNEMYKNAIWTNTRFNDKIKQLCRKKANLGMIELLPSQREALSEKLLDVAANVTVLQMPTSAGKTLLAEFNIIVTKALMSEAKIVYIVPSRALVNQVYYDLKSDLSELDFSIEKTSSAIEIDPTEDTFLSSDEKIDILISTPEKLDLLIRRRHPSVEDVSMFILDEAHTIQNGERGAKLELLMAILRRERPNAKYMLLSPFIKNANEKITDWLGGGNSISVDWKPSEKLILGVNTKKTKRKDEIHIEVLPSPYDSIKPIEKTVIENPHSLVSTGIKNRILEFSIKQFAEPEKTMLVLCYGKGTANSRANFIYDKVENYTPNDDVRLVKKFIEDEVGRQTTLSKVIEKGIVTHHSGMSDETKLLVEHLVRQKQIQFVCATTTIAEGVNFPVSTVFFDDYRRGRYNKLDSNDFWNIAGRAGRTLVDNYGKIILPFNSDTNIDSGRGLIKDSANVLSSVLADLFENADYIEQKLEESNGLSELFRNYSDSLSPLIQYFVHLLTVGEKEYYVSEIEDLFKDSLEYYLLDTAVKKERFISICKSIYLNLQSRFQDKGVLTFADKTGFSVPSVLTVMNEASKNWEIRNIDGWSKEQMFNSHNLDNLTEKIRVIAALRETQLGIDSSSTPFNPELYAKIIIGWVQGKKLSNIADQHPSFNTQDVDEVLKEKRITDFVKKMNDIRFKASWGLSALEGIVRGNEEIKDSHIPSLVYFGVDNEKSLAFRMIGVPRTLSFTLQNIIEGNLNQYSYRSLRKRINNLSNSDWDGLKPVNSSLSGMEWKRISEILIK
ncbi:DEAD/DEAH box helicase [Marinifilum caeruleilacunae]|uniref:DEAD/DEAH box helicase n=1 Tax=Marinifilum caeruleilacunae TaxID=2499076 RepID=A0ABX1WYG3_9BACT|nr:DEAD/DEAH box helicase [Marinifilum caeruleilacunae]NOU61067.1 DEAD/DEAH box helicase [Marinifilum caeruleilacunae]